MFRKLLFTFIIFSFCSAISFGQKELQREALLNFSSEKSTEYKVRKQESIRKADSLGIPVRKVLDNGVVFELQGFESGIPVYYITYNFEGARTISTTKVWPGGEMGFNLDGQGQILGMWDGGATYVQHPEFQGRAIQMDNASTISDHATHVAGTIIAAGIDPSAKGMSFAATLHAYDWNNDEAQMAQAAANGMKVSQHSYGSIAGWYYDYRNDGRWAWFGDPNASNNEDYNFGYYNERARSWDSIAYMAPEYLIVKSAGNDRGYGPANQPVQHWIFQNGDWTLSNQEREINGGDDGYDCIPTNGTAKNILTVGAVRGLPTGYTGPANVFMSSFSSWGPTDDGRIKPDIVAKGVEVYSTTSQGPDYYGTKNGTSMSGPMVTGSIGLLLQHQENLHSNKAMLSSTMKALLIHSADEAGLHPGPDYQFGWGLMNTHKAAEIMSLNASSGTDLHIKELHLNHDQEIIIPIRAEGNKPLKATIVWTDLPGYPPAPMLNPTSLNIVNDLDIRIQAESGSVSQPFVLDPAQPAMPATRGDNTRDNVEVVLVENPAAGENYFVKVTHKGVLQSGGQTFSLIVTGNTQGNIPVSFEASAIDEYNIELTWEPAQETDQVMIVGSRTPVFGLPQNGVSYSEGESVPDGGTVIYKGEDVSFVHTDLDPFTTYYYQAFSVSPSLDYSLGRNAQATTWCVASAELPYFEDFNDGQLIPDCWIIADYQQNDQVWTVSNVPYGLPESFQDYAVINSLEYGYNGVQNSGLISPAFDFTGYSRVTLSFTHMFRQYAQSSSAVLSYSTDGGNTWTDIMEWSEDTENPEDYSVSLTTLADQAKVRFRWLYNAADSHYWMIDDVSITADTGIFADFVSDINVAFDNQQITFSDASGGGDISQWEWDFGEGAVAEKTQGPGPHTVYYTSPGLKTVTLTLDGNYTAEKQDYINIFPLSFEAPSWISAKVENDDVNLRWNQPSPGVWKHYDSGFSSSGMGTNQEVRFDVAHRYTPQQLKEYGLAGRYLGSIAWVPHVDDAEYTIKVWLGGDWNEKSAGNLATIQPISQVVEQQWNIAELDNPVYIDGTKELWIGYQVYTTKGFPAGMDQGKAVQDFGNLLFWNGTWTTLEDFNIDRNFNIHGYFESTVPEGNSQNNETVENAQDSYPAVDLIPQAATSGSVLTSQGIPALHLRSSSLSPVLSGYNLYRDGELIHTANQSWQVGFVDTDLPQGTYQYNVEALYSSPEGLSELSPIAEAGVDGSVPRYNLTVDYFPMEGGFAMDITNKSPYEAGATVIISSLPNEGYIFKEWVGLQDVDNTQMDITFTMPARDLNLTALFQSTVDVETVEVSELNIFPNPSDGFFRLQSGEIINQVRIRDISGKQILEKDVNEYSFSLNASSWKPGIYFVQVISSSGVKTKRLILLNN